MIMSFYVSVIVRCSFALTFIICI